MILNRRFDLFWQYRDQPASGEADRCPYCQSKQPAKRDQCQLGRINAAYSPSTGESSRRS